MCGVNMMPTMMLKTKQVKMMGKMNLIMADGSSSSGALMIMMPMMIIIIIIIIIMMTIMTAALV